MAAEAVVAEMVVEMAAGMVAEMAVAAATVAAMGSNGGNTLRDDSNGQLQWAMAKVDRQQVMAIGDGLRRWQQ